MHHIQWYPRTWLPSTVIHTSPHLNHSSFAYVAEPGNRLGDAGTQALMDALKELKRLKILNLQGECVMTHSPLCLPVTFIDVEIDNHNGYVRLKLAIADHTFFAIEDKRSGKMTPMYKRNEVY